MQFTDNALHCFFSPACSCSSPCQQPLAPLWQEGQPLEKDAAPCSKSTPGAGGTQGTAPALQERGGRALPWVGAYHAPLHTFLKEKSSWGKSALFQRILSSELSPGRLQWDTKNRCSYLNQKAGRITRRYQRYWLLPSTGGQKRHWNISKSLLFPQLPRKELPVLDFSRVPVWPWQTFLLARQCSSSSPHTAQLPVAEPHPEHNSCNVKFKKFCKSDITRDTADSINYKPFWSVQTCLLECFTLTCCLEKKPKLLNCAFTVSSKDKCW